jgi:hypothetical protein
LLDGQKSYIKPILPISSLLVGVCRYRFSSPIPYRCDIGQISVLSIRYFSNGALDLNVIWYKCNFHAKCRENLVCRLCSSLPPPPAGARFARSAALMIGFCQPIATATRKRSRCGPRGIRHYGRSPVGAFLFRGY